MKVSLYNITLWNLLSFFVFLGMLEGLNLILATEHVPFNQIITTSVLFCFLYVSLFISSWKLLSPAWGERIAGVVWAITVAVSVAGCAYPLIYDWLPRLGVHFHRAGRDFDIWEFRERILWVVVFVWLLSMGAAAIYRYIRSHVALRQANAKRDSYQMEIDRMQAGLEARHFSPHTIENVVAITMNKLTTENKDEYLEALMVLADVLRYALRMQDERATVSFAEEWEQVENLLTLGRVCYGRKEFILRKPKVLPEGQLPMGIFVMPIENALKYATVMPGKPILLDLQLNGTQWCFTVTNRFREVKRQAIRSSKTGFVLLQHKIDSGAWPIAVERKEVEDTFSVSIVGNLKNEIRGYEKGTLYHHDFRR
ncbi:histidine kinase [Sphingobacterium sp. SGG-5]|uniref:histidine kinase n=1 Tax=Sphingobacterium sp. SGG-5 TaxID=2710881 RepID=UPI0013E9EF76|nr:histidine kinase [Sphingobacterium sp. SGG-5]NGM62673.1 histidine kinase [Sphingobacterium sp. SGG-5]